MTPQEVLATVQKYFDKSSDAPQGQRRRISSNEVWMEIVDVCPKYLLFKDYSKFGLAECPDLGECRIVVCGDGEYEGEASREANIVMYFEDHDVFIKKEGYYTSYDGYNFDGDTKIVKPKQRVITYYE